MEGEICYHICGHFELLVQILDHFAETGEATPLQVFGQCQNITESFISSPGQV